MKLIRIFLLIGAQICLFVGLVSCQQANSSNNTVHNVEETAITIPYRFRMNIAVADVQMDISVNDIVVFQNYMGHQINTTIPLTIFITPGTNTIGMATYTEAEAYGANPRVKAVIEAQKFDNTEDWFEVTSLEFTGRASETMEDQGVQKSPIGLSKNFTAKIDQYGGILDIRKEFDLNINMVEWNWSCSQKMTEKSPELGALRDIYVDYYNLLKNMNPQSDQRQKSLSQMKDNLSELLNDQALAYNMAPDEVFASMGMAKTTIDSDMSLIPLGNPNEWEVELSANGRLAAFYPPDRDAILGYELKEGGYYSFFPFRFRYDGQKWIPSR